MPRSNSRSKSAKKASKASQEKRAAPDGGRAAPDGGGNGNDGGRAISANSAPPPRRTRDVAAAPLDQNARPGDDAQVR